jgi:hypothetical protein
VDAGGAGVSPSRLHKPNRRPMPEVDELVNGGLCSVSGKLRYRTIEGADQAIAKLRSYGTDPDADQLGAYRCKWCRDYHAGHGR